MQMQMRVRALRREPAGRGAMLRQGLMSINMRQTLSGSRAVPLPGFGNIPVNAATSIRK